MITPVAIGDATLHLGDCRGVLPSLPDGSVDLVFSDPPYPCIDRHYGRWTEEEWHALMDEVVGQCRRVLKPSGSAVFVLQPGIERVGRMRTWLLEFIVRWAKRWNWIQDAYWWNFTAIPCSPAIAGRNTGLMKSSVKTCVWLGPEGCYRDQGAVLWRVSDHTARQALAAADRWKQFTASGHGINRTAASEAAVERGGSSPFNLLPVSNARGHTTAGSHGHGAGTPLALCDWWLRYLCPPGGVVLDPFSGTATVGVAAARQGKRYVGVEALPEWHEASRKRLQAEVDEAPLFAKAEEVQA